VSKPAKLAPKFMKSGLGRATKTLHSRQCVAGACDTRIQNPMLSLPLLQRGSPLLALAAHTVAAAATVDVAAASLAKEYTQTSEHKQRKELDHNTTKPSGPSRLTTNGCQLAKLSIPPSFYCLLPLLLPEPNSQLTRCGFEARQSRDLSNQASRRAVSC